MSNILEVSSLTKTFHVGPSFRKRTVEAVKGVSFNIERGKTYGLVGESGSGKSTVARLVSRLTEPTAGSITFSGRDISTMTRSQRFSYRREVQMIFQDPYSALNPRMTVEQLITEPWVIHRMHSPKEPRQRALKLMKQVGLPKTGLDRKPVSFSGGQRQRIMIARALALEPKLIVGDEPVSALDVSVQAQVLNLLRDLQDEMGLSYLFISHDLSVVEFLSDRIGVMYLGDLVEEGTKESIYRNPQQEYTKQLISAIPTVAAQAGLRGARHLGAKMTTPDIHAETGRGDASLQDGIDCHLGIRFAAIEHRFAPPIPATYQNQSPARSSYGPSPIQPSSPWLPPELRFDEDCLNLNIWSPAARSGVLPVVVWLYGGGFEGGSSALPQTRGSLLAAKGDMVVVSLNYRVGAFGFSYLADRGGAFSHATNLGVQDVIAGLRWVNENIHNFGGDSSNVTVIGESAGGFIAAALAAAPTAKGLFQRLAMFSGGASRLIPLQQAKKQADTLVAALEVADRAIVLLDTPTQNILAAQRAFIAEDIGARNAVVPQALGIVLDAGTPNAVLQRHPLEAFTSGELADIPILVSSTQDEISTFRNSRSSSFDPESHEALKAEMNEWGIRKDRIVGLHGTTLTMGMRILALSRNRC